VGSTDPLETEYGTRLQRIWQAQWNATAATSIRVASLAFTNDTRVTYTAQLDDFDSFLLRPSKSSLASINSSCKAFYIQ